MVTVDSDEFCPVGGKYSYFPDGYTANDGVDLCKRFGGSVVNISTRAQFDAAVDHIGKLKDAAPPIAARVTIIGTEFAPFTKFRDELEYNRWIDFETGEGPIDPLPWAYREPNGGDAENCAHIWLVDNHGLDHHKKPYQVSFLISHFQFFPILHLP